MEEYKIDNKLLEATLEELSDGRAEDDFQVPVAYSWKEAEDDDIVLEPIHED